MPIRIKVKSLILYFAYFVACVFLNGAVSGVPLGVALYFSMLICGANGIACTVIYIASSIVNLQLIYSLCALFEGAFLLLITTVYRRANKKIKLEAVAYLAVALSPFIAFSSWVGGDLLSSIESGYAIRAIASALICAFSFFCFKSVYAIIYRLYRSKLKEDEIFCISVLFVISSLGVLRFLGEFAYFILSVAILTWATRLYKSPSSIVCGLVLASPCAIVNFSLEPITAYIIISIIALLFANTGKVACGVIIGVSSAIYAYLLGFFEADYLIITIRATLICAACLLPTVPPESAVLKIKNNLEVKKLLPQKAVISCREQTGERLYKIAEVFREIECAFKALDEVIDDAGAKRKMLEELKERCCTNCHKREKCKKSTVYKGFIKLINAGCVKGKVNLIDLPSDITVNCAIPAEVIVHLNGLLVEYRRFMLEAENAKSGRVLLANQARGVAEVMKNCAVELCKTLPDYSKAEEEIKKRLCEIGISCPEIYISGEDNLQINAVICGNENANRIIKILNEVTKLNFILQKKICYDNLKLCYEFISPTTFDAAFGVASTAKKGERVSGDTHSVIKINEHRFLMALSDGMGSGKHAHKVSATAISLIEAFYRAEMPEGTVLDTINKLLSFSRDERFTCIDIAAINLNTGRADFVKIGSPAGIIIRAGEIKVLESTSLPMGILESLRPTVATESLRDGDIVVFMSDGITSAFSSTTELYEYLQTLKPLNPQSLADKIMLEAKSRLKGSTEDDMTVLCTRIFNNPDAGEGA
ncbi:MAG: hypothetical protein E7370_01315 [Clostridiales bacterium]|nr:hypothetical protein [Clostridiales bacterium]